MDGTLPPGDDVPDSDDHAWAEPVSGPSGTHPVRSARPATFPAADRSSSAAAPGDFTVAAQLDPDVRSVGLITPPTETAAYRVRAYYYGAPSNVVHRRTGNDQSR